VAPVGNSAWQPYSGVLRTLAVGAGTSGSEAITYLKALYLDRFGVVPPGTRLLAFDVLESPPAASLRGGADGDQEGRLVRLEPGVEYVQIGRDCDPARLSHLARTTPEASADLRWLLQQQPDGRFARSLHVGSERPPPAWPHRFALVNRRSEEAPPEDASRLE
jgi:hypothetical protein